MKAKHLTRRDFYRIFSAAPLAAYQMGLKRLISITWLGASYLNTIGNREAINEAMLWAAEYGLPCYIPTADLKQPYNFYGPLEIPSSGFELFGDNRHNTKLRQAGLNSEGIEGHNLKNVILRDFQLTAGLDTGRGLWLDNVSNSEFRNLYIWSPRGVGWTVAVDLAGTKIEGERGPWSNRFIDCYVRARDGGRAYYGHANDRVWGANSLIIERGSAQAKDGLTIHLTEAGGAEISGMLLQSAGDCIRADNYVDNLWFHHNRLEGGNIGVELGPLTRECRIGPNKYATMSGRVIDHAPAGANTILD